MGEVRRLPSLDSHDEYKERGNDNSYREEEITMSDVNCPYCGAGQENDHDMEPFGDKWPDMYQCKNCDFYRRGQE
jgi:hypothetical protein